MCIYPSSNCQFAFFVKVIEFWAGMLVPDVNLYGQNYWWTAANNCTCLLCSWLKWAAPTNNNNNHNNVESFFLVVLVQLDTQKILHQMQPWSCRNMSDPMRITSCHELYPMYWLLREARDGSKSVVDTPYSSCWCRIRVCRAWWQCWW